MFNLHRLALVRAIAWLRLLELATTATPHTMTAGAKGPWRAAKGLRLDGGKLVGED